MGPMRTLTVTINWILFILWIIAIGFLVYGLINKNSNIKKYALIAVIVIFVLLFIAVKYSLTIKDGQ